MRLPGLAPTEAHYEALVGYLERTHGVTVLDKEDAPEHVVIGTVLQELFTRTKGLAGMPREDWLTRYATTLGTRIAMPSTWPVESRFRVLAHELGHVLQHLGRQPQSDLPSGLGYALGYALSQGRVRSEVECDRAMYEVDHARGLPLPTLDDAAGRPDGDTYLLTADDRALIRSMWDAALPTIAEGVVSTEAARTVLGWIRREAPELLAREGP